MRSEAARARLSTTLKAMKHGPRVRGGNGRLTSTEWELFRALSQRMRGWCMRQILTTSGALGLPNSVKVDVSNPWLMLAVELSGASHGALSRQDQDQRKIAFLRSQGWEVMTFTNREVRDALPMVTQQISDRCRQRFSERTELYIT